MTTQQLQALDLLLVALSLALWLAAAVVTLSLGAQSGRRRGVAALSCAVAAAVVTLGRAMVVALLVDRGWWFAADKVLVSVPLAVVTGGLAVAVAMPFLRHAAAGNVDTRRRPAAVAALFAAVYGSAAGLLVAFVVGYPVAASPALVIVALVVGLSGLTWLGLRGRRRPGGVAVFAVLCLIPLLTGAAVSFYSDIQPVVIGHASGDHTHLAAASAGAAPGAAGTGAQQVSVSDLRTPAEPSGPVRRFQLTARQQTVTLPSGRTVDAWTFGSLPGPEIRVRQGDLVEVTLINADIADGVTVHWHGYPVPNGEDGVAGVTQDAVLPGGSFVYRFVAKDAGTYWYHAHQVSSEAVGRGLFGALVVEPYDGASSDNGSGATDLTVAVHTVNGITTLGGTDLVDTQRIAPGDHMRLRMINTDSVPHRISVTGAGFTVVAVDGTNLNAPTTLVGQVLRIPAGGRFDISLTMVASAVTLGVEGAPETGMLLVPDGASPGDQAVAPFVEGPDLDLLSYGAAAAVPGMTGVAIDREATLVLDRQFRFLGGVPTFAQTVNGEVHPHVPPIVVREGELLRLTVVNRGSDTHPMHPHGHRVLVESRDGVPVTGSPVWLDTFDVRPGEVWVVLLRADNPGIWMAHCHNLEHATQGMVVHLVYEGVTTPYSLGGAADNRPE
jgi:FtsP/CotA-like multicopper oxidase with cupredoxin domain